MPVYAPAPREYARRMMKSVGEQADVGRPSSRASRTAPDVDAGESA